MPVTHDYVEQRAGDYWITGTQVSLNSLVQVFRHGAAPMTIARFYPALSIEQVYAPSPSTLLIGPRLTPVCNGMPKGCEVSRTLSRCYPFRCRLFKVERNGDVLRASLGGEQQNVTARCLREAPSPQTDPPPRGLRSKALLDTTEYEPAKGSVTTKCD